MKLINEPGMLIMLHTFNLEYIGYVYIDILFPRHPGEILMLKTDLALCTREMNL